mgnify:CR=1 FL=1
MVFFDYPPETRAWAINTGQRLPPRWRMHETEKLAGGGQGRLDVARQRAVVPEQHRHIGGFIRIQTAVAASLTAQWLSSSEAVPAARKARISPNNSSPPPTTLRPVWQALKVTNEAGRRRSKMSNVVNVPLASDNPEKRGLSAWKAP